MCVKTKVPQLPGMSSEETYALDQTRKNLDQMQTMGGQYGSALQSISGLFNPDGSINQEALQTFGTQVRGYQDSQRGIYDTALSTGQAENDLYNQALQGTGPVSEGLKQQKTKDFQMLKASAAKRGIKITGDSFDNATSTSTAGIRMLGEMGKRYDLAVDNERSALRQWGSGATLNRMGALTSFDPNAGQMGYLNQATVGMLPVLSGINEGYMGYMQPYQQQRMAQFGRDSSQSQADAAYKNSLWQGAGQLAGTAASMAMMPMTGGMSAMAMPSMTSKLSMTQANPSQFYGGGSTMGGFPATASMMNYKRYQNG